jgi:hypothetical protein
MQKRSYFVHLIAYNTMEKQNLNGYYMNEIDYFKVFVLLSGDVAANVDHLHVKKIHLVSFSYIVIDDYNP